MKLPDLFVNAVTTFDGKALAKGQKQIGGFEKSVKSLAKAFGVTFGAAALAQFGKKAVKAFAEDEAAAARLTKAVQNLGLGFEDARIKNFISDLERTAYVADDVLRPAFQSLLQTTGSFTKSQELLNLALDVSAGSGIDLATVSKDLSLAYLGQTKGLTKYDIGLTKAELSTAGFAKIQTKLNAQYSGQNAARLDTYAGKMAALNVAFGNAQETIGEGLIESFSILAGDNGIGAATNSMDDFSESIKYALIGLADLTSFEAPSGSKSLFGLLLTPFKRSLEAGPIGALIRAGEKASIKPKPFSTPQTISGSTDKQTKEDKARAKAEADAARRAKEILALTKKQQIADKNKLSLSKAAAVFDSNRISIAAALQATYDKETRLRLEALMAIEDENGTLALQKIGELAAFQKNADMAKLAGVTQISEATLSALNTQLLAELKIINDSKMAEKDKEAARDIAFGKYNAAITAAGELAAKESYSERVQIQLTEIARLASLSNTTNAALTLSKLRESAELSMIDRIAAAQKLADEARLKALQEYLALLAKAGNTIGGTGGKPGSTGGKAGDGDDNTDGSTTDSQNRARLEAEAKARGAAALKAQQDKLQADFDAWVAAQKILAKNPNDGITFNSNQNADRNFDLLNRTLVDPNAGVTYNPNQNKDRNYEIIINAGVISQPEEFAGLIQDTIQRLNRGGDPLTTAGVL